MGKGVNNIKILITLIGAFAFCAAYKFFSNHIRQQKAMALKKKYIDWVTNEDSVPDMETYQYDIIELFKAAKVKNVRLSLPSRGMHKDIDIALFDNLLQRRTGIIREVLDAFDFAIGYYRSSKRKAISPLYWIESIIFLPKKIIEYIGADLEKTAFKITNLILTAIWWLTGLLFTLYKAEIFALLQSLLEKFAK